MNKKNFLGLLAAVVFTAVVAVNVNIASQERGISNIAYANVEALADDEGPTNPPTGGGGGGGESSSGVSNVDWWMNPGCYGSGHPYGPCTGYSCSGQGSANCP
jgi:hypothetical protein